MPGSWRRGGCLALVLIATAGVLPAHGDESPTGVAADTATVVDPDAIDETIRLLRRDTNFVLSYPPGGPADVRVYRDGDASENPAEAVQPAEQREQATLRAQALGASDAEERVTALHALLGTEVGRQTALEILARDREPEVLKNALDVLTGYVTLPLEPVLAAARNQDPSVRIQALELLSLHRANDPRVEQVLTRAAATDADEDVRESARALIGTADSR
jgi:hypothetical protein